MIFGKKNVDLLCWPYYGAVEGLRLSHNPLYPPPSPYSRVSLLYLVKVCRSQKWNPRLLCPSLLILPLRYPIYFDIKQIAYIFILHFFYADFFLTSSISTSFSLYFIILMCFSVACVGISFWLKLQIRMVAAIKRFN